MTKQEIIDTRNILFDEDFSVKSDNIDDIKDFCKFLTDITGIQCCTSFGYITEMQHKVYNSVIKSLD